MILKTMVELIILVIFGHHNDTDCVDDRIVDNDDDGNVMILVLLMTHLRLFFIKVKKYILFAI